MAEHITSIGECLERRGVRRDAAGLRTYKGYNVVRFG